MKYEAHDLILYDNIDEACQDIMGLEVTREITHTQLHHTYVPDYGDVKRLKGPFEFLNKVHDIHLWQMNNRGFFAGADQVTILPNGWIVIGRPDAKDHERVRTFNKKPAGIKGHNDGGICVEILGNFNWLADTMTPVQRKSVLKLFATLHTKFNLPLNYETCVFHNWFSGKSCPGTGFMGYGNTKSAALHIYKEIEDMQCEINEPWKAEGLEALSEKGIINDLEGWRAKLDDQSPNWMVFAIVERGIQYVLDEVKSQATVNVDPVNIKIEKEDIEDFVKEIIEGMKPKKSTRKKVEPKKEDEE